ncbi:uncharacterized protein LOC131178348 [Hevea brasiliensis]|uniref:uncharacterized protein LOC131178348 n=1 Tax=Hevea brasiliensis TaxID=3981 RepID=UPI0025D056D1|nr:uncharacterized protein LOC131178348 [Hevea brasiliensis]
MILPTELLEDIRQSWVNDFTIQQLITDLQDSPFSHIHYTYHFDQLRRNGKLVVGNDVHLREKLLQLFHSSATGGHSGANVIARRLSAIVYWPGLWRSVQNFVRECSICQRYKYETVATQGLLQPLPLPTGNFIDLTMDFIEAIQTTPFEALYGVPPPLYVPYVHGDSHVEAVDLYIRSRETAIALLQHHLQQAMNRMKQQVDKHRTDREFDVGDMSAYRLRLPSDAIIHNVFHVSLLKPAYASIAASSELPPMSRQSVIQPQAILDRRIVKRKNATATQLLVHWQGYSPADATWEFTDDFQLHYPFFSLRTRNLGEGSIVTNCNGNSAFDGGGNQ